MAEFFRLKPRPAETIVNGVVAAVKTWKREATASGIPRAQQERMANAFRLVER